MHRQISDLLSSDPDRTTEETRTSTTLRFDTAGLGAAEVAAAFATGSTYTRENILSQSTITSVQTVETTKITWTLNPRRRD